MIKDRLWAVLSFSGRQSEHVSKLRELARVQWRNHVNAPATVHKVRGTLVMHRPERSEDGEAAELGGSAKHRLPERKCEMGRRYYAIRQIFKGVPLD